MIMLAFFPPIPDNGIGGDSYDTQSASLFLHGCPLPQHHAGSKQYRHYNKQNRYDTNNHSEHFQRPPFVVSGDSLTVDQAYHAGDAEYRTGSEKYLPLSFFLRIILSLCVFLWYNAAKLQ